MGYRLGPFERLLERCGQWPNDGGELAARTAQLAGHLHNRLALQPGDRVAILMGNHVSYLEVPYAAWWAGLVVVPINAKLHPRVVEFILADAGAVALFVSDDLAVYLQPLLGGAGRLRESTPANNGQLPGGGRGLQGRWCLRRQCNQHPNSRLQCQQPSRQSTTAWCHTA